jgi:hypothetical protein
MFSYQNKVVGIKIRGQGFYDVFINNGYVGSTDASGSSDAIDLIGSNDTSLNFGSSLFPEEIVYDLEGFRYTAFNDGFPSSGVYQLESTHSLIYDNQWKFREIISGSILLATGGSDPSNPFGYYSGGGSDVYIYTPRPSQISWYYESASSTGSGIASNTAGDQPEFGIYQIITGAEQIFELFDGQPNWLVYDGVYDESSGIGPSELNNPYGVYTGLANAFESGYVPYSLTVSQYGQNSIPTYHFSNLLLNTGSNELCFENRSTIGETFNPSYEINFYDISGSTLVSPIYILSGSVDVPPSGSDCASFNLTYPTVNPPIVCPEFDPNFDVDTGNLNQIFTGSGVHLQKDVTFFFDILDQQLNTISSNQQFVENPLISGCVFDVVNIDGTTALANFFTGKYSRSVTVTALDNENIFGTYRKDFGVRCKLPNTFDGSIFTGVFLAYGNVPNILDIVPNYSEFSGAAQATESFNTSINLQNDLKFTQMDRYDVYALTGSGSAVNELTFLDPVSQEGYLLSQSAVNVSDTYNLTINRGALPQDVPHYFTVVPYGALGSGSPFMFGPATFVSTQTETVYPAADISAENIYFGTGFSSTIYKTGRFSNNTGILHEFSSGQFTSVKYFIEISGSGQRRLSELKGVVNTTGFDLTKESVNDTLTTYRLTGVSGDLCGLHASGIGYSGFSYKLQATMI